MAGFGSYQATLADADKSVSWLVSLGDEDESMGEPRSVDYLAHRTSSIRSRCASIQVAAAPAFLNVLWVHP